jgi:hypothetical protein
MRRAWSSASFVEQNQARDKETLKPRMRAREHETRVGQRRHRGINVAASAIRRAGAAFLWQASLWYGPGREISNSRRSPGVSASGPMPGQRLLPV